MDSPVNSFMRFVVGFFVFLSMSFGVTYIVAQLSDKQDKARQTAASFQVLVGE